MAAKVAIIMGSDSDLPKMNGAAEILKSLEVPFLVKIVSAHRTPKMMVKFASEARKKGIKVIIAGAGGAAHLPGMVASVTDLPVIGVPVLTDKLNGLDSLLSIAQMPKGVPVATMAVDNSFNAGLFAARILALNDSKLKNRIVQFHRKQRTKVYKANSRIKKLS